MNPLEENPGLSTSTVSRLTQTRVAAVLLQQDRVGRALPALPVLPT